MTHLSEDCRRLSIQQHQVHSWEELIKKIRGFADVCVLRLPPCMPGEYRSRLQNINEIVYAVTANLGPEATLVTIGDVIDLVHIHTNLNTSMRYQLWIAVKRTTPLLLNSTASLPSQHFGALMHTKYDSPLRHTKTRIGYAYCPACDKTTKDYGGKKHTYHEYGTLISDVWRNIACDLDGNIEPALDIIADFFGIEPYQELRVSDLRPMELVRVFVPPIQVASHSTQGENELPKNLINQVLHGDCLEKLTNIPDDSVDFGFVDPPYNLGKKYLDYDDDMQITDYFNWCDTWLGELARVLKPGRTLSILNIPLWSIRHFLHLETILNFQTWLAWDALSFPVRLIMPSHYAILCFSKGIPRDLPGLTKKADLTKFQNPLKA